VGVWYLRFKLGEKFTFPHISANCNREGAFFT
jgi:hypothetical protein